MSFLAARPHKRLVGGLRTNIWIQEIPFIWRCACGDCRHIHIPGMTKFLQKSWDSDGVSCTKVTVVRWLFRSSLSFLRCQAAYVGLVNGAIPEYSNFLPLYLGIWFAEVGSLHSWPRIGGFLIINPDVSWLCRTRQRRGSKPLWRVRWRVWRSVMRNLLTLFRSMTSALKLVILYVLILPSWFIVSIERHTWVNLVGFQFF